MVGKIIFKGILKCLTGLHIGGNQDVSEIGGVDSLVLRDPYSREPYIPGSSIKGKTRSLLEKYFFLQDSKTFGFNRKMAGVGQEIRHHECDKKDCLLCRLFGASKCEGIKTNTPARLYFRDAFLNSGSKEKLERMDSGYYLTEIKYENTLDRITAAANPRQIERVPRGSEFVFEIVYNYFPIDVESPSKTQFAEDFDNLTLSLLLLQDDYIGGNGSRGYGQIEFRNLSVALRWLDYYNCVKQSEHEENILEQKNDEGLYDFVVRSREWLRSKSF